MDIKITVAVAGVDLSDVSTLVTISESLSDLTWATVDGRTTFTLHVPEKLDPVCAVADVAHRVEHVLPSAELLYVDEDLVSASDIASRIGVSRETVRTWALSMRGQGGFPVPRGTTGGGARGGVRVWAWGDVCRWLEATHRLVVDERQLDRRQVAEVNAHLARLAQPVDRAWRSVANSGHPVCLEVQTAHASAVSRRVAARAGDWLVSVDSVLEEASISSSSGKVVLVR